ncbi:MAG: HAMP domain-containing protein [Nitrosomonadales bacterium]|nr:HAMP domain-containing protein [Nitrosomonadales bacterium]
MKSFSLTIRAKIITLAVVAVLFLAAVGGAAIEGLNTLSKISTEAVDSDAAMFELLKETADVRSTFQRQVQEWKDTLLRGNDPELYAKYYGAFEKNHAEVEKKLRETRKLAEESELTSLISVKAVDELLQLHEALHQSYVEALKSFNPAHADAGQEVDKLVRGIDRPFTEALTKIADSIANTAEKDVEAAKAEVDAKAKTSLLIALASLGLAVPLLIALGVWITRGIIRNLAAFQKTINLISEGNFEVRAKTDTGDELGTLAKAFNELLDSRVATLAQIQQENEQLNESVLGLLRAVAQIAKKDLTVKVPVSEDVTGAVSDALNLLSSETAKVLLDVSNISADVTSASLKVQQQADNMLLTAAEERGEVEHTAQSLSAAARAMHEIAELAQKCNAVADNAIKATEVALSTVNSTVSGINNTRDVIRETEKRIKRLGERSQEISGAVNLINVIAERTHILALNASMHAASAGEAGRGFAVVADEVQRLAENSRQATQQIAALVNNIQIETADTVNTMNDAITQIVEGSRLAEQAGQQMHMTQQATSELVDSVKQIAASSAEQARSGQELVELASLIKISSEKSSEKLQQQSGYTSNLVEYAKQLLAAVRVFKLPG